MYFEVNKIRYEGTRSEIVMHVQKCMCEAIIKLDGVIFGHSVFLVDDFVDKDQTGEFVGLASFGDTTIDITRKTLMSQVRKDLSRAVYDQIPYNVFYNGGRWQGLYYDVFEKLLTYVKTLDLQIKGRWAIINSKGVRPLRVNLETLYITESDFDTDYLAMSENIFIEAVQELIHES